MNHELREQVGAILQTFPPPAQESGAISATRNSEGTAHRVAILLTTQLDPTLELEQLRQRAWKVYALSFIDNSTTTYTVNITNSFNESCWNDDHSDRSDNSTQTSTLPLWLAHPFVLILLLATLVVFVQEYSINLNRQGNLENPQQREVVQ